MHEPLPKFKYKVKVISFLVSISFLVWALKVHEPYISHQIAEVTFLAAYIPLGYKLLDLQWSQLPGQKEGFLDTLDIQSPN